MGWCIQEKSSLALLRTAMVGGIMKIQKIGKNSDARIKKSPNMKYGEQLLLQTSDKKLAEASLS